MPSQIPQDTIVAISTPPGRGGIGIVRLSGPAARPIVAPMLRLAGDWQPALARLASVLDTSAYAASGEPQPASPRILDEAIVTFWAAPRSYTGEDIVEVALHGSPILLEQFVRQCCAAGARLARPGEFTERAFLAGRIDLTQAEAVDDLIASSTLEQARLAARQMGGELARAVGPSKARLVNLIAALEAGIDFAEDDIDVMPAAQVAAAISEALPALESLLGSFARGRILRQGIRVAIVGRPNAGKSSLFNRLVDHDRAIVTASPGTTRDTIAERISLDGIPGEIIDTAGLREAHDEAERLGIARSREAMADADVVILVIDATSGWSPEEEAVVGEHTQGGRPVLLVWNKSDLVPGPATALMQPPKLHIPAVHTSALTGAGIPELRRLIRDIAGAAPIAETGVLTSLRQHAAVESAVLGLRSALAAIASGIPHEVVLVDLYEALRGLDSLTGATTTEDVLQLVFSRFCIGK